MTRTNHVVVIPKVAVSQQITDVSGRLVDGEISIYVLEN